MKRLVNILLAAIAVVTVYISVKLIAGIIKKLRIKEKADAAMEWYMNLMRRLFGKMSGFFKN